MNHKLKTQQREMKWNRNLVGGGEVGGIGKKIKGSREMNVTRMYDLLVWNCQSRLIRNKIK